MKNALIKNEFDGPLSGIDKLNRKYLRFMQDYEMPGGTKVTVFEALRSKDIEQIEASLVNVANHMRSNLLLIGMSCLVIERENLYQKVGFRSYSDKRYIPGVRGLGATIPRRPVSARAEANNQNRGRQNSY